MHIIMCYGILIDSCWQEEKKLISGIFMAKASLNNT